MVNLAYIRKRKARRIITAIALGCAGVAIIIGAIALLGQRASPFTVKLSNAGANLSLFTKENDPVSSGSVYLIADQVPEYTPFSEEIINGKEDMDNEGTFYECNLDENNEETATRFFKYTFYVANVGNSAADYDLRLTLNNETNQATNRYGIDSILRVRMYENRNLEEHNYVTYAKSSATKHKDENDNDSWKELISVPGSGYAEEFLSTKLILKSHIESLKPQEKVRYTFVFWLEGDDPECVGKEAPVDSALTLGVDISAHEAKDSSN